jgi:hypothetical protein
MQSKGGCGALGICGNWQAAKGKQQKGGHGKSIRNHNSS